MIFIITKNKKKNQKMLCIFKNFIKCYFFFQKCYFQCKNYNKDTKKSDIEIGNYEFENENYEEINENTHLSVFLYFVYCELYDYMIKMMILLLYIFVFCVIYNVYVL